MRTSELETLTGGLSRPSKMPGFAWSISARHCGTGGKLQKVSGSVCSKCYALRGRYVFPNVQKALERRLEAWRSNKSWVAHMVALLSVRCKDVPYFRWFDSGDLASEAMLRDIVAVANALPLIHFWLPTKEAGIVKGYSGQVPANLTIRLSAPMIGLTIPPKEGMIMTSSVNAGKGWQCPAPTQGNKCLDCRACWDSTVRNVDYQLH